MLTIIISGFIMGIFGSLHCIGMCGPLVMAIPLAAKEKLDLIMKSLVYNLGRIISYTILGILLGIFGQSISIFKYQQFISITLGILIILLLFVLKNPNHLYFKFLKPIDQFVKSRFSKLISKKTSYFGFIQMGILNGLLPCGLVFTALLSSVTYYSVYKSALFMLSFGFGTLPSILLLMIFGQFIPVSLKYKLGKIAPYIIGLLAIILILRGMNLGIPFISPLLNDEHVKCCH